VGYVRYFNPFLLLGGILAGVAMRSLGFSPIGAAGALAFSYIIGTVVLIRIGWF